MYNCQVEIKQYGFKKCLEIEIWEVRLAFEYTPFTLIPLNKIYCNQIAFISKMKTVENRRSIRDKVEEKFKVGLGFKSISRALNTLTVKRVYHNRKSAKQWPFT